MVSSRNVRAGAPRHTLVPLDSPGEWTAALDGIGHAFAHTWASCQAMHLTTGLPTYLYRFEAGHVRIVCPIAERTSAGQVDIVTPYGFSGFAGTGACPDFPGYWEEFAASRGYVCGYLGLNPLLWDESYGRPEDVHEYNHIYTLDLTLNDEELQANLSANRRRQLRSWDATQAALCHDRDALSAFVRRHHGEFLAQRGASRASYLSEATLCALFDRPDVVLVGAGERAIEAVSVFAYTSRVGDFLFNVSVEGGRRHSAALIWYGVTRLKALNVPVLNLGGGIHENDGVAAFKQRFGARRLPLKSLRQIYDRLAFASLCRRADADPADRQGYFPPYRAGSGKPNRLELPCF
jgi:hypothetical protein